MHWKYVSSISRFVNYLYRWIYCSHIMHKLLRNFLQEPGWPFASFWNYFKLFWKYFTLFYLPPFDFIHCTTRGCSLLLVVIFLSLIFILCHSLSFVCHSLYHSLWYVATCHSLYHTLSLNVPPFCLFINDPFKSYIVF